jgi:anti-sigma B factor antagonist
LDFHRLSQRAGQRITARIGQISIRGSYMTTEATTNRQTSILHLSGRFDAHQVPAAQKEMEMLLNDGATNLVIDLTKVHFVDSSGLAMLVKGMLQCRRKGGEMVISGPAHPVRVIFELTRMDQAIRIFATEADALAGLK